MLKNASGMGSWAGSWSVRGLRVAVLASAAVLAACSTTSPDVIKPGDAQRLSQVSDAVVLSVRPVVVEGSQSGAGATTGAVLGLSLIHI